MYIFKGDQMTKEEAKQKILDVIASGRRFYQPVVDFPQCTKRSESMFKARLDCIVNDYPEAESYLICGSSNGFNAFQLAGMGRRVVGVEVGKNDINFCRLLSAYYGYNESNPKFIHGTILDYLRNTEDTFDSALILMVWHHIFKPNSIPQALETMNLLANKAKRVYLSTRDKPWMKEQLNITYVDTPDYLVEHTEFTSWEEVEMPKKSSGSPDIAFSLPVWVLRR